MAKEISSLALIKEKELSHMRSVDFDVIYIPDSSGMLQSIFITLT